MSAMSTMSALMVKSSKDGGSSRLKARAVSKQRAADCEGLHVPPEWLVILLESLKGLSSEYPVLMSAASAIHTVASRRCFNGGDSQPAKEERKPARGRGKGERVG